MPEELIAKYFNEVRLLAVDLVLDFDLLMDETGTDHERSRLRRPQLPETEEPECVAQARMARSRPTPLAVSRRRGAAAGDRPPVVDRKPDPRRLTGSLGQAVAASMNCVWYREA